MFKLLVTLVLFLTAVFCEEASNVLDLTADTHDSALKENEIIMVEYFAPWCGHCKKLAPEYEKAANTLAEKKSNIKVAKVDCTIEKAIATSQGIKGFPTLKTYKNGELHEQYKGARTAEGIVEYLEAVASGKAAPAPAPAPAPTEATGPTNVVTLTSANFKEEIKKNPVAIVKFYAPWCGHCKKMVPDFEKAATELKDEKITVAKVDCTVEKELAAEYGIKGYPTLNYFENGEFKEKYSSARTADAIVSFLKQKSASLGTKEEL